MDTAEISPPPTSAVRRALEGLSLASAGHAASLAAQAKRYLEARDGWTAWLLAERLMRLRSGLIADDYVLRALAWMAVGDNESARRDIRGATLIDPGHAVANRLSLTSTDPGERSEAARRLLRSGQGSTIRREALRILRAEGVQVAGGFESTVTGIRGWIAWQGAPTFECHLAFKQGSERHGVEARSDHPMAGVFDHVAALEWPWPPAADAVTVTCDAPSSVLQPRQLWRADQPPALWRATCAIVAAPPVGLRRVAVIVPVYDDLPATTACFQALLAHPEDSIARRIIVVDDATPDRGIAALLDDLERQGDIVLARNKVNLGFAASVNRALAMLEPGEDALLLNADTVPPPALGTRLAHVAHAHEDIATVTPLSNNGEYTSLPVRFRENPLPSPETLAALDRLAADLGDVDPVTLPNGIGFCLYVKHAVLEAIGPLSLRFGRGYGEDIEFCLRARAMGFRHVCAGNVFVGHAGSRSFKSEKRALVVENLAQIDRLYPSYRRESARFVREDPLQSVAGRLEWAWLLARRSPFALVIAARERDPTLIDRYADAQRAVGLDTIIATPQDEGTGVTVSLRDHAGRFPQNVSLSCDSADGLARDLARLPIAVLAVMDPGKLPAGLMPAIARGLACDVLISDALSARQAHPGAHRIVPATTRLTRVLRAQSPESASRILDLPHASAEPGIRRALPGRSGALLIVGEDAASDDVDLIRRLAADLGQADARAGIIVDGGMDDDLATMVQQNIFVLGREPARRRALAHCPVPISGVVFTSRRWGAGDTRVDDVVACGVPVAYYDPSTDRSEIVGHDLLLSLEESVATATTILLQWWSGLSAAKADRRSPG
ncbi:glycosyltransferase family 2 protein [Reyranella sp. CPCC 100927]|uniref:glycosyltransferase family 2 protein n=1 Tax=Reyranella sp. CPCC 100927 TaxID=2599616 RepID=UPI0011B5A44E|nr:glycosyltransferase [Reyranella sp. CPCC 100927]TWT12616.1 glycosyltransferase family 2 protein [Reyranella sp. CPCC 100927]